MDPGTTLGAFSLAFQIFAGCIKGFQLLLEAKDLPQKYGYLRHRLHLEQQKLLDWWNASNFAAEVAFQGISLDERTQIMVNSLVHIKSLTLDINRIKGRYDLALKLAGDSERGDTLDSSRSLAFNPTDTYSTSEKLRLRCLKYADTVLQCPTRLRWAVFDAAKLEQLLMKLSELNSSLHFNLELAQKQRHIQLQEATHMQILKVHNRLDQVAGLIQSLHLCPRGDPGGSSSNLNSDGFDNLERLARFKALSISVGDGGSAYDSNIGTQVGLAVPPPENLILSISQLEFREDDRALRVCGTYDSKAVWVEWKSYDDVDTVLAYHCIKDRIERLTTLLANNASKPEELRLPDALGYIDDTSSKRFGIVFKSPGLESAPAPQSLYSVLQTTMKPSLTARVSMAQKLAGSLDYLHATNWLHKGLRSDNILFLEPPSLDLQSFCLSGFDYSRPANPDEATEFPSDRREHDLYRHPDVQFDVPRDGEYGYKEKHDIYSLGVVLMEIGLWQPIHQFLGISLNQLISRPAIRAARRSLLDVKSLAVLTSEAGERFSEAVRLCLVSEVEHSLDESKDFAISESNIPLQGTGSLQRARRILQSIMI
ncbi:prion-inhibition and propagation-domain-containing protein [Hypomontagnella monticulosa]|nr:prion-inhibition and propagation-domain-containing protein [Hypomontagnella monticulosa]